MRIVFAGTPEIAVPSLKALADKFDVCAVLTNPDRATGRGRKIVCSPVKEAAMNLGLTIFQPEKLDSSFLEEIKALKPDLLAFFAYGKIFKKDFLDLFPLGGINVHPSLLPKYRGPSPINEAIKNGDQTTAITVQRAALKMDSGDILLQPTLELDGSETTGSLSEKIAHMSAPLIVEAVEILRDTPNAGQPQNHEKATFCKLIDKTDGLIDWNDSAVDIERAVRAYSPWPGAYTFYGDKKLNILASSLYRGECGDSPAGTVVSLDKKEGIVISTGQGALAVTQLQLQSKKIMDYKSFINGNRDFVGSILKREPGEIE